MLLRELCQPIREKHWELLVITVALAFMKQRITVWVKAERCSSVMRKRLRRLRLSVKRVPTEVSIIVDRLINIPGWIMVPPICPAI